MTYKVTQQWPDAPLDVPIELVVCYWMELPKATSKKKFLQMLMTPHTKKPDCDNLLKLTCDAMLGVVYNDDGQIWSVSVEKVWTKSGEGRTEIEVTW